MPGLGWDQKQKIFTKYITNLNAGTLNQDFIVFTIYSHETAFVKQIPSLEDSSYFLYFCIRNY